MSNCRLYREMLKDRMEDTMPVSPDLQTHLDSCPDCRRLFHLHDRLKKAAASPEPPEERFERMREAVRKRILAAPPERKFSFRPWAFFHSSRLRAAAAAGILFTVAAGSFILGRVSSPGKETFQSRLVDELYREAARDGGPVEAWNSKYTLSNVSLRRLEDGRLNLGFDVTSRVQLTERPDAPLVRGLLLQSVLNTESPGLRIKGLSNLKNLPGPQAVEALIFTLHNDPVPAVRTSAFDILAALPGDPVIEAAMLRTLREDVAVELRLRALDYLAGRKTDPARIRESIDAGPADSRPAVLVRAAKLLAASNS